MLWGSGEYEDKGDESDRRHAIPTASGLRRAMTRPRGMRTRIATMLRWMRRKIHRKPMMDQHRMLRTEDMAEPVMSTGMRTRLVSMWMERKKHCKLRIDPCRMWMTEGIVLESVKIRQYSSEV
jgi:hypothetical protein